MDEAYIKDKLKKITEIIDDADIIGFGAKEGEYDPQISEIIKLVVAGKSKFTGPDLYSIFEKEFRDRMNYDGDIQSFGIIAEKINQIL